MALSFNRTLRRQWILKSGSSGRLQLPCLTPPSEKRSALIQEGKRSHVGVRLVFVFPSRGCIPTLPEAQLRFCGENNTLAKCQRFDKLNLAERVNLVREK